MGAAARHIGLGRRSPGSREYEAYHGSAGLGEFDEAARLLRPRTWARCWMRRDGASSSVAATRFPDIDVVGGSTVFMSYIMDNVLHILPCRGFRFLSLNVGNDFFNSLKVSFDH